MIKELLDKYNEAKTEIFTAFGHTDSWESITNEMDKRYMIVGEDNSVNYFDSEGEEYWYDYAASCCVVDVYELFYCQDNGEKFYAIFSVEKRCEDWEEYENLIDTGDGN